MCGIAGFINPGFINQRADARGIIEKMLDRMISRGPDAKGYWQDERTGVMLGHRRLSIVDLSENGAQPMVSADGRYVVSYNGEIYNAPEIREELLEKHPALRFRGTSDTEVMLEAFAEYGVDQALQKMKGMFAIALYDRQERTLMLMRDRVGEKPLYYGFAGGEFVFFLIRKRSEHIPVSIPQSTGKRFHFICAMALFLHRFPCMKEFSSWRRDVS